jgi:hypothetical protein
MYLLKVQRYYISGTKHFKTRNLRVFSMCYPRTTNIYYMPVGPIRNIWLCLIRTNCSDNLKQMVTRNGHMERFSPLNRIYLIL